MNSPIHVLHVDDDSAFSDLTATVLEREDRLTVVTATGGRDALDYLSDHDIDCVVSDYDMPRMNGIELLEAVRETAPRLPFILFTGKGSEEIAAEAVEADVSGYLQKGGTDTFELLANRVRKEVTDSRVTASYREYKTVIDSLTDAVYVTDEDGRFSDVNEAFCELTGYDEGTIVGSHPSLIKDAEAVATVERHLRRVLSAEGPDDALFEIEIRTADGRTVRCEDHLGVVPFENDGGFQGTVGTLRDVSNRRRSERFRREFYELTTAGLGFEETCRRMLRLGCERLGLSEGKLVRTETGAGTHETVLVANDTAREGRVTDLSRTYCRRVVETNSRVALHDVERTDWADDPAFETYGHACYVGVEVLVDGDQYGTICFFDPAPREGFTDAELTFVELVGNGISQAIERDRSRRRSQRQERTRRRMHEIVSDHERTHTERIRDLLRLGRKTLGADYAAVSRVDGDRHRLEVLEAPDREFQEGDELPLSGTLCERTVAEQETQAAARIADDAQYRHHPVHTELGVECYIGTPLNRDGEVYGTLCFMHRDPRDRPFVEWERTFVELTSQWVSYILSERESQAALARERDRLEEFAGVVSHDLRNPLRVVRGQLELAQGGAVGDTERLDAALAALDRAETLIEDLLDLSRTGESVGELVPVELSAAVEDCWRTVAPATATLEIETECELRADPNRFRQVMENLLRNAVEHGGADVTVTVTDREDGFRVADDGPGIPADEAEAVFETGYSTAASGTGFGLAIAEEIVTAHGWEIGVAESADGGARVDVTGVETSER